jgi:hypothetical protein
LKPLRKGVLLVTSDNQMVDQLAVDGRIAV